MAKCDLCGGECKAHAMTTLLEQYQIPGVAEICPDCTRWANKTKSDLLGEIAPSMRSAIAEKKGQPLPAAPVVWWARWRRAIGAAFSA